VISQQKSAEKVLYLKNKLLIFNSFSLLLTLFCFGTQCGTIFCIGDHRYLRNIECLMAHTACLVCFISTVNGHSKKKGKRLKMWY
jgi:hypothetical protein